MQEAGRQSDNAGESSAAQDLPPGPVPRVKLTCSEAEAAFVAGWLCADGCILCSPYRGGKSMPKVRWRITDLDPLERIRSIVGHDIKIHHGIERHGFKPGKQTFDLAYTGHVAAAIVHRCWPWLSIRYRTRYAKAVDGWVGTRFQKLDAASLAEIREALRTAKHGDCKRLAEKYGVTDGLISAIRKGRITRRW